MSQWLIKPSYKYDLASFCNLFTKDDFIIKRHENGYSHFKEKINKRPDLIGLAKEVYSSGFNPAVVLISFFDYTDYEGYDIEEICLVMDDENLLAQAKKYFIDETKLLTEQIWETMKPTIPLFSDMAKYIHNSGFLSYWKESCLSEIQQRCEEFNKSASKYSVIDEVNNLLGKGYELSLDTLTLYLCKFAAPYGSRLKNQSFTSDIRWDLHDAVATALHEMIHPPFEREKIAEIAELLWKDEFMCKADEKQRDYNTPLRFMEENIVEGAHVYLAEKMGVIENPLQYFIDHDRGSHVASVIIYNELKNGIRENVDSLEVAIFKMIDKNVLEPGKLWENYHNIYKKAGLEKLHPYQD